VLVGGGTDSKDRLCPACSEPLSNQRFCSECGIELGLVKSVARDPFIGALIADRYEIVELIGSGGMGRVYRGQQRTLDRPVAIKLILSGLSDKNVFMQRFAREAQTASRLITRT
jgi:eukaryotic-like serine/threonine-protein kinase